MKRILAIVLVIASLLGLSACGDTSNDALTNKFIVLGAGETLNIGTTMSVTNSVTETTEEYYLDYVSAVTYTLHREYWSSYYGTVPEGYYRESETSNYYLYWEKDVITSSAYMGNVTQKKECTYQYIPYAQSESIAVKRIVATSYSYDFAGGFIEKEILYNIDLNGYYESMEELERLHPDFAKMAYTGNTSDRYYVDTTIPKEIVVSEQSYSNTYYYITSNTK